MRGQTPARHRGERAIGAQPWAPLPNLSHVAALGIVAELLECPPAAKLLEARRPPVDICPRLIVPRLRQPWNVRLDAPGIVLLHQFLVGTLRRHHTAR
jgi:hypothetical protein